jgi:hypothetical protein
MPQHMHYSPFQFSTAEQTILPKKEVIKEKKLMVSLKADRKKKTHDLGCTMPLTVAHSISDLPNAYISPNGVAQMKDIKAVFMNC